MTWTESVVLLLAALGGGLSIGAAVAAAALQRRRSKAIEEEERRFTAVAQLEQWQAQGLLAFDGDALKAAVYWETADPKMLERLVHLVGVTIENEGIEPGGDVRLIVAEKPAEKPAYEKPQPLELTTAFG